MKKVNPIFILTALLSLFTSVELSSINISPTSYVTKKVKSKRIYIDMQDIEINENGFWLRTPINSIILGSRSLHADKNGTFILRSGIRWICPNCGEINDDISKRRCNGCGKLTN